MSECRTPPGRRLHVCCGRWAGCATATATFATPGRPAGDVWDRKWGSGTSRTSLERGLVRIRRHVCVRKSSLVKRFDEASWSTCAINACISALHRRTYGQDPFTPHGGSRPVTRHYARARRPRLGPPWCGGVGLGVRPPGPAPTSAALSSSAPPGCRPVESRGVAGAVVGPQPSDGGLDLSSRSCPDFSAEAGRGRRVRSRGDRRLRPR
jgi:hypothetical protein